MTSILISMIIAIIGTLEDGPRMAVCEANPHIVEMAKGQGYTVFEDCSFTMED